VLPTHAKGGPWCDRLAGFKCPEALLLASELPKTATGKVAKNTVRAQVAGDAGDLERAW
jgi:long-chain acyl-CoA synthetase